MARQYYRSDLAAAVRKVGIVDRFVRFGGQTFESRVTLHLVSDKGRRPTIQLALGLMDAQGGFALAHLLTTYDFADQTVALSDGLMVAAKLGLALVSRDADGNWQMLADPDTNTVVVPGSVVLWED